MIKKIKSLLNDPDLDFQSKSFVVLSSIALIGLFSALISGFLLGQSLMANLSVLIECLLFTGIFLWAVYRNRIKTAMILISFFLVFVFLPSAFFSSGGAAGGTPVWFMFSSLFIIMTLSGKPKIIFLISDVIIVSVCWWIGYTHPETVTEFTRTEAYFDSYLTLLIVIIVMTLLISYQALLFRRENDRVNKQKKEIEELSLSQKRFFSSMSHEIRTPINTILGLNEVILRQEGLSDEIKTDAGNIQGAGKMLLAIINDILDFSKMEAGRMDIVPVDYRIKDMLSDIANMIDLRAREKGLSFEVNLDPDTPSVLWGDEIRIKQIIINLLNNAVKYTSSGTVRLELQSENAGDNRVELIICVSDTGIGIRQEVIPTLFDAFKRADQERNRYIEGTGLGLSIVKQLVDLMGGEVSVESVYGEGTTFTVQLVQRIVDPKPVGEVDITDREVMQPKFNNMFTAPEASLLIVDDSKMNLIVEEKLLRGTQIMVDTAVSGADALELTRKKRYDVILMDHFMPKMDGLECFEKIRSQIDGKCTDIPIVVLTANAEAENREMYEKAGFDGYIIKPVSGSTLREALIRYLPKDKIK